MRRLFLVCAVLLLVAFAGLAGGSAPFGRVALSFGLPTLAAPLLRDPLWRGVAHYRAGAFAQASDTFAAAGPQGLYNLGNALTQQAKYAAALEAYDLALAVRDDRRAQQNFDLLRAFYAGTAIDADSVFLQEDREGDTAEAPIARGSARAAGTGDDVSNTGATLGLAEMQSHGRLGVRRVFDDRFIVASPQWLETLEDVPGAFLGARIQHAYKQRRKAGIGQIAQDTPW
ncbi:tetratricopeptide repeat protein [Pseudophaeobacter leonis]|uniref:tetratricopeptide repeat protein n=1 Tax=Pseudophaeobacter leonis TaxID=1144477 RepID=UPI0009F7061C|nr:tetratricopeptide repeat protein [Pseudophaeobacter leonis]